MVLDGDGLGEKQRGGNRKASNHVGLPAMEHGQRPEKSDGDG